MLIPFSNKHSISKVVANVIIPQNIIKPELLFGKIKTADCFKHYQRKNLNRLNTINIHTDGLTLEDKQITGFFFEEFDENGQSIGILKIENLGNKAQINFENRNYTSWTDFKNRLFNEIKCLSQFYDIFIEAITLTYVDEFGWKSEEKIDVKQVFNQNSKVLNEKFMTSFNGSLVLVSQSESTKETNVLFSEERTEVLFNNQVKRIAINHTFAFRFNDSLAYEIESNVSSLKSNFDIAHDNNKKVLKDILSDNALKIIHLN